VLTATQNGYGKRTQIAEYTRHGRGTQGMIAIHCSERNGKLVAAELVAEDDEIVLITTGGVLIRTRVSEVREAGRSTQGVRLINLGDNEALAGLEKIVEPDDGSNGESANGDMSAADGGNGESGNGESGSSEPDGAEPPEGSA
jgi:DNA gyrase subunit A